MKYLGIVSAAAVSFCLLITVNMSQADGKKISGEKEFKEHCAICHPDGGNIVNPQKTLHKKDLDANGIKKADDIIKKMRDPGPGMTRFDKKTVSDKEAKSIADFVLQSLK
jgi:cytochrome c6